MVNLDGDGAANSLTGTDGDDRIRGFRGRDDLDGRLGNDLLWGGRGRDVLIGDAYDSYHPGGDDWLYGGAGGDLLAGGPGNDTIFGGGGDDILVLGSLSYHERRENREFDFSIDPTAPGRDVVHGGAGEDLLFYRSMGGQVIADLAGSHGFGSIVSNGRTVAKVTGVECFDIWGSALNDDIVLGSGDDVVFAGRGDDHVVLGAGDDVVQEGGGNDVLDGGAGRDEVRYLIGDTGDFHVDLRRDGIAQDTGHGWQTLIGFEDVAIETSSLVNVRVNGDHGDNRLSARDTVNMELNGLGGDDWLVATVHRGPYSLPPRDVRMNGGGGSDVFEFRATDWDYPGGRFQDHLVARRGAGNDVFTIFGAADAQIDAGAGNDHLLLHVDRDYWNEIATRYDIRLGRGVDTVTLSPIYPGIWCQAADAILLRDFTPGERGDTFELRDWAASALIGWDGENPFATGHFALAQDGDGVRLLVDRDGSAGDTYELQTLATFESVRAGAFTRANFDGWDPDAEALARASERLPIVAPIAPDGFAYAAIA